MSENVAPTNVVTTTTTTQIGKEEPQKVSTLKSEQGEQREPTETSRPSPGERREEHKEGESTLEKLKHMTIGKKKHEEPTHGEEKHVETYETIKDSEEKHQIIEILGEGCSDLKITLIPGMESTGVQVKSWSEDPSTRIRHILCGANVLEMVLNQEKYIHAINQENLYSVTIPKRSEHHEKKFIPEGYALCWEFTLESYDIEFILKELIQDDTNVVRHTVISKHLCQCGVKMQGKWEVTGDTTVILAWNNSYSRLTSKKINFRMTLVNV